MLFASRRTGLLAAAGLLALLCGGPAPVLSADFYVEGVSSFPYPSCSGIDTCTSVAPCDCLDEALAEASNSVDNENTIWIRPTGADIVVVRYGVLSAASAFPVTKTLVIRGELAPGISHPAMGMAANNKSAIPFLAIDPGPTQSTNCPFLQATCDGSGNCGNLTVRDLHILADYGQGDGNQQQPILVADTGATARMENCILTTSGTDSARKPLAFHARGGSVTVERTLVDNFDSSSSSDLENLVLVNNGTGAMTLIDCRFEHNTAKGPLIYVDDGASLTVSGTFFSENTRETPSGDPAVDGVVIESNATAGSVNVTGSAFAENSCSSGTCFTVNLQDFDVFTGNEFCGVISSASYRLGSQANASTAIDFSTYQDACGMCGGAGLSGRRCDSPIGQCSTTFGLSQRQLPSCSGSAREWFLRVNDGLTMTGNASYDPAAERGSEANPFRSLPEALPHLEFRDTLTLAAGAGEYALPSNLTISGTFSANTAGPLWTEVDPSPAGSDVNATGFTIRCAATGRADLCPIRNDGDIEFSGAGVSRDLVLKDLTFVGSGRFQVGGFAAPTFQGVTFSGKRPSGAGIDAGQVEVRLGGWPRLEDCTLRDARNHGLDVENAGVEVIRTVFRDIPQPAVYVRASGSPVLEIRNSTFLRNGQSIPAGTSETFENKGGAITALAGSTGVAHSGLGRLTLAHCRFSGNAAGPGGTSARTLHCGSTITPVAGDTLTNSFCDGGSATVSSVISCGSDALWSLAGSIPGWDQADACGVCGGNNESLSCNGTCFGVDTADPAGSCCDQLTEELDCANRCDRTYSEDSSGTCCMTTTIDCAGLCGGPRVNASGGVCCQSQANVDCAGVCNGTDSSCVTTGGSGGSGVTATPSSASASSAGTTGSAAGSDSDGSTSDGLIIGLAVGGGVLLLLLILAVVVLLIWKKRKEGGQKDSLRFLASRPATAGKITVVKPATPKKKNRVESFGDDVEQGGAGVELEDRSPRVVGGVLKAPNKLAPLKTSPPPQKRDNFTPTPVRRDVW